MQDAHSTSPNSVTHVRAVTSNALSPPDPADRPCFRAAKSADPSAPDQDVRLFWCIMYPTLRTAFVGLQVAYLFGGRAANGMAYADYARRGFFELVAAACLSSVVVIVLESTVVRRTRPYLAALIALIALTGVVLASAALRLRLYQDAYGWTELRLCVTGARRHAQREHEKGPSDGHWAISGSSAF
jgi:hypothetical protein